MPWHMEKGGGTCEASEWAVIKDDDGSTAGCHDTEAKAKKQLAALYANEGTMSRHHETRDHMGGELRAVEEDGKHYVTLQAIKPGVVDDYGSVWMADTFDKSLDARLPVLCWSHDWSDPLGPGVEFTTSEQGPRIKFAFDDFDSVPTAKRAFAQVMSGTIQDCSVGFSNTKRRDPTDEELAKWPGVREVITQSNLDEVSLVLAGAVPGAKVLAVRSAGVHQEVPTDTVIELARKIAAGEISNEEAKAALGLLLPEPETPPPPPDTIPAAEALADAVLTADPDDALEAFDRARLNVKE